MPFASANGMQLAYDVRGDAGAPGIVLIMGLGTQMIAWPDPFCDALATRGFRVARFDNRDIGLSTKVESAGAANMAQAFQQAMAGKPVDAPYTLVDMAGDTVGVIDALGIEKAHVVGASMGGMIAQIVAATHPNRVRSLVSIMSTSGARGLPQAAPAAAAALFGPRPAQGDREAAIRHGMNVLRTIGSPGYPQSDAELRAKVERAFDRAYYPAGVARHFLAVLSDGSRVARLKTIAVPTLVIHGADDPLVPLECGKDTARHIPGATLKIIPGMGHDLAPGLVPTLVDLIAAHCSRADGRG